MLRYVTIAYLLVAASAAPSYDGQEYAVSSVSNPNYGFNYAVSDPLTGDNKAQTEHREGGVVKGSYSLAEPDGTIRVVDYSADPVTGFNAVVKRIGPAAHPQQYSVAPAPIVKTVVAAPVAAPIVAAPIALDLGLKGGYALNGLDLGLKGGYGLGLEGLGGLGYGGLGLKGGLGLGDLGYGGLGLKGGLDLGDLGYGGLGLKGGLGLDGIGLGLKGGLDLGHDAGLWKH